MKNLKKVLALVLVIAMVMGFAVSASATEFSDSEEVAEQNATAVEVLTSMNLINGYPDGTFRPEDSISRAEVAKIIAVMLNGGVDNEVVSENYANVVCGLTDIGGTWAESYIKYCYTVGAVDGYPDGTYRPENDVTILEMCQIMLNLLGYELDTTNYTWANAVLSKSNTVGLLTSVSGAVGSPASRQEAVQVIYNALTLPIQKVNALGVRIDSDETLLSTYLGGSVDTVVVVANSYASLTDDEPTKDGYVETADGETLKWSSDMVGTDLLDIGKSYTVWTVAGTAYDTVIYAAESGLNDVEVYSETVRNLSKTSDLDLDDAESYVNYDDEAATTYTTDIYISYEIAVTAGGSDYTALTELGVKFNSDKATASGYYKAGADLSSSDVEILKYIFKNSVGEVYVGTQSTVDISDMYSWKAFANKYLSDEDSTVEVTSNENGNLVQVIDNDADGNAEYILKIEYAMAAVYDLSSKGAYTLSDLDDYDYDEDNNTSEMLVVSDPVLVDAEFNVVEDAPEEGDVVVYSIIDGVVYMNEAATAAVTIDDINYKTNVITGKNEETYGNSAIDINKAQFLDVMLDSGILFDVTDAAEDVEYTLYLDNYGYVRALTPSTGSNGLGLLTDAYYYSNGRVSGITAQVEMVTTATEAKTDYTVSLVNDYDSFIDCDSDDENGEWGQLISFQEDVSDVNSSNYDSALHAFKTNITSYSGDTDSLILNDATDYTMGKTIQAEVNITSTYKLAQKTYTTIAGSGLPKSATVYATEDTIYYYVNGNAVTTWTGYENAPSSVSLTGKTVYAYTVATMIDSDGYYTADAIVIEVASTTSSAYFFYDSIYKATGNVAYTIAQDDDGDYVSGETISGLSGTISSAPAFYTVTKSTASEITKNFSSYNIFADTAATGFSVASRNYVAMKTNTNVTFKPSSTPVFKLTYSAKTGTYSISEVGTVEKGDKLIYVTNYGATASSTVLYAIDVTQSTENGTELTTLWQNIQTYSTTPDKTSVDLLATNYVTVSSSNEIYKTLGIPKLIEVPDNLTIEEFINTYKATATAAGMDVIWEFTTTGETTFYVDNFNVDSAAIPQDCTTSNIAYVVAYVTSEDGANEAWYYNETFAQLKTDAIKGISDITYTWASGETASVSTTEIASDAAVVAAAAKLKAAIEACYSYADYSFGGSDYTGLSNYYVGFLAGGVTGYVTSNSLYADVLLAVAKADGKFQMDNALSNAASKYANFTLIAASEMDEIMDMIDDAKDAIDAATASTIDSVVKSNLTAIGDAIEDADIVLKLKFDLSDTYVDSVTLSAYGLNNDEDVTITSAQLDTDSNFVLEVPAGARLQVSVTTLDGYEVNSITIIISETYDELSYYTSYADGETIYIVDTEAAHATLVVTSIYEESAK